MKRLFLALIFIVSACHPQPVPIQMGPDVYGIPIQAEKIPDTPPAKVKDPERHQNLVAASEKAAAETDKQLEEVIVVPPSTTTTTIKVSRKKQTVKQVLKEVMTNIPTHTIEADNPSVKVAQPHKSVWWRWLILFIVLLMIIAAIAMAVASRIMNLTPAGITANVLKFVRGK